MGKELLTSEQQERVVDAVSSYQATLAADVANKQIKLIPALEAMSRETISAVLRMLGAVQEAGEAERHAFYSGGSGVAVPQAVKCKALELLRACFEDELAHLQLRMIRDRQQPRFEALKKSHPDIYEDFMRARNECHEVLLKNRRERVEVLRRLVEGVV